MKHVKTKMLTASAAATALALSGISAVPANATMVETAVSSNIAPPAAVQPRLIGWKDVLMAAFEYFLANAKSPVKHAATFSDNGSRATSTPGSVSFNKGSNGVNTVDKAVFAQKAGHKIEMWGNSQQLFYTGKMGVVLRKGSAKRINRTVGHNQYSTFTVGSGQTGNYIASFNSTSSHKWRVWVAYYHYGTKSLRVMDDNLNPSENEFLEIDDKMYLIPSENHIDFKSKLRVFSGIEKVFSFEEIYEQFYDQDQESLVDVPKNLSAGQSVTVEDQISSLRYDAEEDATFFYFNDARTPVELPFKGDYTGQFAPNDTIKLKFNTNAVAEGYDYVTFDYTDSIEKNGEFPALETYLAE